MRKKTVYFYEFNDFHTRLQRSDQNYISRETFYLLKINSAVFVLVKKYLQGGSELNGMAWFLLGSLN